MLTLDPCSHVSEARLVCDIVHNDCSIAAAIVHRSLHASRNTSAHTQADVACAYTHHTSKAFLPRRIPQLKPDLCAVNDELLRKEASANRRGDGRGAKLARRISVYE